LSRATTIVAIGPSQIGKPNLTNIFVDDLSLMVNAYNYRLTLKSFLFRYSQQNGEAHTIIPTFSLWSNAFMHIHKHVRCWSLCIHVCNL